MNQRCPSSTDEKPEVLLKQFFQQHGYVRGPNETRKKQLGQTYKKGYEVRLVAKTQSELAHIRHLLGQIGFKAGKPFRKHGRIVQPIYGKSAVEWFSSSTVNEGEGRKRKQR